MKIINTQINQRENKSLGKAASVGYSEFTTQTIDGHRNRYTSGLFLPTLYHFKKWHGFTGFTTGVIHSLKLVTWAIERNKALSTNKLTCSMARVDPTLHPNTYTVQHFLLTKTIEGISMLTYLFKAISRRDLGNTRKPINQMTVYTLKTIAESEEQARALFSPYYVILNGSSVNGGAVC